MSIASFDDLQDSMKRFLKRPDLAAQFPDFIMLAEQFFDRKVKTRARRSRFSVTPTGPWVALPTDWARVIYVSYGGTDLDFFPASIASTDIFRGYRLLGDKLSLTVPQLGQRLDVEYYVLIEALSSSNQSNWLLEDAPDIYLAGALTEGFGYIRDAEMTAFWQGKRDNAIQDMLDDDAEAKTPEDQPLVMRAT